MITSSQRERFHEQGLIRLDAFLPAGKVAAARSRILRELESPGYWIDGEWHLDGIEESVVAGSTLLKGIKRASVFQDVMTAELCDAITELADGRPTAPIMDRPQILFTLPNAAHWTIPHTIWHIDVPRLGEDDIPGIQAFAFLDVVEPGGGGTLVVAGSHRLLNTEGFIRSADVKRRLKRAAWFHDLMSREVSDREQFMRGGGRVGDVEVQVVELHGGPGDVYLMDMRVLHTLAPNASARPRIMLTQRFLLETCRDSIMGGNYRSRASV